MREKNACPSLLAELADALHARCLVVIRAYADDSGRDDEGIFAVAGYAFTPGTCGPFERQWRRVLKEGGPKPVEEFKTSNFMGRRKDFEGWSDHARRTFFEKLVGVINTHGQFGIKVATDIQGFNSLTDWERKRLTGGTGFTLTAGYFVERVMKHVHPSEPVTYYFDDGPKSIGWGKLKSGFDFMMDHPEEMAKRGIHIQAYSRVDSQAVPQIQAADLIAWKSGWEAVKMLNRPTTRLSRFAEEIFSTVPMLPAHGLLLTTENLRLLARGAETPAYCCVYDERGSLR